MPGLRDDQRRVARDKSHDHLQPLHQSEPRADDEQEPGDADNASPCVEVIRHGPDVEPDEHLGEGERGQRKQAQVHREQPDPAVREGVRVLVGK